MEELPISQVTDSQVIPNQTPSIAECVQRVMKGQPLPPGFLGENKTPIYQKEYVNDYRIRDELTHIERMRRNLETVVAYSQSIAKAARTTNDSVAKESKEQGNSDSQSTTPPKN